VARPKPLTGVLNAVPFAGVSERAALRGQGGLDAHRAQDAATTQAFFLAKALEVVGASFGKTRQQALSDRATAEWRR
jgi:hypothetical protein